MSGAATASSGRRALWPLWVMVVIFALPAAAAWFFYLNPGLLPSNRVNRGELIEPVRPWPAGLELTRSDGSALDARAFGDRWTRVVPSRAPSASTVQKTISTPARSAASDCRIVIRVRSPPKTPQPQNPV